MVGLLQSYAVALDGTNHLLYRLVLRNDVLFQFLRHALQSDALFLRHALYGDARHHRYHIGHLFGRDLLTHVHLAVEPLVVQCLQFALQHSLAVTIACCQLIVLVANGVVLVHTNLFEFLFLLGNLGWNGGILQMYARTRFIHRVYCLVRHETVTDVTGCQFDTSLQCIVGVCHVVMIFVATLHILQDLQRLLIGGGFYHHLLETALQGSVLFDGVAVFVQRRGSDTLYGSASQCRLQDVCGIHCTSSRTRTNHGVYLVDKYNDIRILLQFFDEHLHALFKLSAILRTSYHTRHVERHQTLVEEHRRTVVCGNHLCQSFDDGTLSNARLTNEYRVVFLAATKDFDDALDLVLTSHAGV